MSLITILAEHKALMTGRWLTDLANTSAFLFAELKQINWVGFYLLENQTLWLGPFQGKPACTSINVGRGVCGKAVQQRQALIVPDVHDFEDHIACDANSKSEIVIPIFDGQEILGVLDVDSPIENRFSKEDQILLEKIIGQLLAARSA